MGWKEKGEKLSKEIKDLSDALIKNRTPENVAALEAALNKMGLKLVKTKLYHTEDKSKQKEAQGWQYLTRALFNGRLFASKQDDKDFQNSFNKVSQNRSGVLDGLVRYKLDYERKHGTGAEMDPAAYDFSDGNPTVWNTLKKIPELAGAEGKIREQLAAMHFPPEKLPNLNVNDFIWIMSEKKFEIEESYKAKHTKRFIAENEEAFRAGLLAMDGVKPEYVDALAAAMKQGRTDLSKEKGADEKPKWEGQPFIDVHHKIPVSNASSYDTSNKDGLKYLDDYDNMLWIVRDPSHDKLMHPLVEEKILPNGKTIPMEYQFKEGKGYKEGYDYFAYRVESIDPNAKAIFIGKDNAIGDEKSAGRHGNMEEEPRGQQPEAARRLKLVKKARSGNE